MRYREVPTNHLLRLLNLQPLDTRLDVADLVFLHKLVNGAIYCSDLLAKINLMIPGPTRSTDLFVLTFSRANYLKFGPLVLSSTTY